MSSECKYSFLEAKARLESLCAYQERCSFDLDKKMRTWGLNEEDRNALLAHLIENNFLSEERFAEAYVSGKTKIKRWGKIKIVNELKRKKISDYSIKRAFKELEEDLYEDNVRALIQRKYSDIKGDPKDYKNKVKVYRFLASKGYETDLIKREVERFLQDVE